VIIHLFAITISAVALRDPKTRNRDLSFSFLALFGLLFLRGNSLVEILAFVTLAGRGISTTMFRLLSDDK